MIPPLSWAHAGNAAAAPPPRTALRPPWIEREESAFLLLQSFANESGHAPSDPTLYLLRRPIFAIQAMIDLVPHVEVRTFHEALETSLPQQVADRLRPALRALSFSEHKPTVKLIAQRIGFTVPETFVSGHGLKESLDALAERRATRFCIKPVAGKNGHCVRLLEYRGNGAYFDLAWRKTFSREELVENLETEYVERRMDRKRVAGRSFRGQWMAEEIVAGNRADELPDDFKFYTFYGEIVCVLQKRRIFSNSEKVTNLYRWYDASWRPIHTGKYSPDPTLEPPQNADTVTSLVREASRRLPIPFCRIDVYLDGSRVVAGELTRKPGGANKFSATFSRTLAAAYNDALRRIVQDIDAGNLDDILSLYAFDAPVRS